MLLTTISLSPAQADLVTTVIVGSPWFKNHAKCCTYSSGTSKRDATLTFQVWKTEPVPTLDGKREYDYDAGRVWQEKRDNSDNYRLMDLLNAASIMGYPRRTVEALQGKVGRASRKVVWDALCAEKEAA
jgi:hypothetical protein